MATQYVKKINGYVIKDEEARATIAQHSTRIGELETAVQSAGKVDDVKVNDTSIIADKVANLQVDGTYSSTNKIATVATVSTAAGSLQETIETVQKAVETAQSTADNAHALAEGRSTAHVFETQAEMLTCLQVAESTFFNVGDHLLIKATDVPDYWVTNVHHTGSGDYGHFDIAILETAKVDLSGYVTDSEFSGLDGRVDTLEEKMPETGETVPSYVASKIAEETAVYDTRYVSKDGYVAFTNEHASAISANTTGLTNVNGRIDKLTLATTYDATNEALTFELIERTA